MIKCFISFFTDKNAVAAGRSQYKDDSKHNTNFHDTHLK